MTTEVRVRVQFFAALREALGAEQLEVMVPSTVALSALKATVLKAAASLLDDQSHFERLLNAPNVRLAVNRAFSHGAEIELAEGDELAFLPPVTGG